MHPLVAIEMVEERIRELRRDAEAHRGADRVVPGGRDAARRRWTGPALVARAVASRRVADVRRSRPAGIASLACESSSPVPRV